MPGTSISTFEGSDLNMALVSTFVAQRIQRDEARGFWLVQHPEGRALPERKIYVIQPRRDLSIHLVDLLIYSEKCSC